ncbi:MAG: MFS transporter [Crocinitomicaceae bacterium]|nr:MFS transporter [Crocinitomicaceae bacterium]
MSEYKKDFWMLAISMLLFMSSFNLLIPELNSMMELLKAGDKKGLVFIFFSIAAAIARPISGKLADSIGRKKVMYIGAIVGALSCLAYPFLSILYLFLFLRFIHGFSAGFYPTGATAMVTDLLPSNKRGLGMGIWGIFVSVGFGLGQILTYPIIHLLGYHALFIIAFLMAIIACLMVASTVETLPEHQKIKFSLKILRLKSNDLLEPSVRPAAVVMFFAATCSGFVYVLTPDIATYLELENKGLYFGFYAISSLVIRLFTASLSDKIGRRKTLIIAMVLLLIAMLLTGFANNVTLFLCAATMYGFASGISSPALMAWMADLSLPHRRGVGSGTLFIALEGGFMLGAGLSILVYNNTATTVMITFILASLFTILAILYLIWHLIKYKTRI